MQAISAQSRPNLSEMDGQDLSGISWSISLLLSPDDPLMEAIASRSIARLTDFIPPALSNIAWSFSGRPIQHDPLMQSISSQAIANLKEFESIFTHATDKHAYGLLWTGWRSALTHA